jgi:hypothetical protein
MSGALILGSCAFQGRAQAIRRKAVPRTDPIVCITGTSTPSLYGLCLEESDALLPGQFPDAFRVYMEMVKSRKGDVSDMTLAVLHDVRAANFAKFFAGSRLSASVRAQ